MKYFTWVVEQVRSLWKHNIGILKPFRSLEFAVKWMLWQYFISDTTYVRNEVVTWFWKLTKPRKYWTGTRSYANLMKCGYLSKPTDARDSLAFFHYRTISDMVQKGNKTLRLWWRRSALRVTIDTTCSKLTRSNRAMAPTVGVAGWLPSEPIT